MSEQIISKTCTKCKQTKALSEFHKDYNKKDKHRSDCKVCQCATKIQYRQSKHGKIIRQRYAKTEKGKNLISFYNKQWRLLHPERILAVNKVMYAICIDKLKPAKMLKCTYCSKQAEDYHHYLGYAPEHWLDVIPVCRKCHCLFRKISHTNKLVSHSQTSPLYFLDENPNVLQAV